MTECFRVFPALDDKVHCCFVATSSAGVRSLIVKITVSFFPWYHHGMMIKAYMTMVLSMNYNSWLPNT